MKYVCETGDTYKSVAEKFDVEVDKIKELNEDVKRLKEGVEIEIPEIKEDSIFEDIVVLPNMKIQSKLGNDVNLRQEKSLDSKVLKVLKNGLELIGTREDGWVIFEDGFIFGELVVEI